MNLHRWIQALLEYEPHALDSLRAYLAKREGAVSAQLMAADGPELYRAQGAFAELQAVRATLANAVAEARHQPEPERTIH